MALVESEPKPQHSGVFIQPKFTGAEAFWSEVHQKHRDYEPPEHVKEYYDSRASGGQHSYNDRTVYVHLEASGESLGLGAKVSTKVQEIIELLSGFTYTDPNVIQIKRKTASGTIIQKPHEEVAGTVYVSGCKGFKRPVRQYPHTLLIIGAGLGGMQTMMDLKDHGRQDLLCVEKLSDFGGHSWIKVANKFTKLQTEKGTYHVSYMYYHDPVPKFIGDLPYTTWPHRDLLLKMFREAGRTYGLYEKTKFNTSVEKVIAKNGYYAVSTVPENTEDGDGEILMTSAVLAWPGNLMDINMLEFPGEDEFEGYIEYASFDRFDYDRAIGKKCVLYGHGAFTIENVRTLVEHRCQKVYLICRKRNLCGMKVMSWMVGRAEIPIPGNVMLDGFQLMYDLVGFDVWTAHSVQTDAAHSFAQIAQKTVFGVTDIYFLAGYYGLMECIVDEIKRLTYHTAHTKKNKKYEVELIVKAIGTSPSFKVDKTLGIKELVGIWINGDPMRPVSCNGMFVQARNFGSFSSGPGFWPNAKMMNWFIDYPEDWLAVKDALPHNPPGERPAYVPGATYFLPMQMALTTALPFLANELNNAGACKAKKQREAHPVEEYLPSCRKEWDAYIRFFRKHGMVDDRPDPPYPYTEENVQGLIDRAERQAWDQQQAKQR